jgi:hypothetical protein
VPDTLYPCHLPSWIVLTTIRGSKPIRHRYFHRAVKLAATDDQSVMPLLKPSRSHAQEGATAKVAATASTATQ